MPEPSLDLKVHTVGRSNRLEPCLNLKVPTAGERLLGVGESFLVKVCFGSYIYTQFGPVSRESIQRAGLNSSFLS